MSTLADLSFWLPSEFLTADDIPINKTHHRYPYNLGSPSSTESESDDDDHVTGLTRRFTRSVSLQERLQIPYPNQKKWVFSSSPESTLNWNLSSPATPVGYSDEHSWERIVAAAGQIARMKMEMSMNIINSNDDVFANGNLRGPLPPHHHLHQHHHHPNWMRENEEFIRHQNFHHSLSYGPGGVGRCGTNRPVVLRQSAWPPQGENPRRQQPVFAGSGGGCGRTAAVKKECTGTGVFLPRTSLSQASPESKKKPGCLGSHLPARGVVAQSYNKTMGPINPQHHQPNMYSGITPHPPHHINRAELAEIVRARRHAAMQRRGNHPVGPLETKFVGPQEVVLPQEWTY